MKHKNLFVLLILIIIWSLFFAIYKYFMWGIIKNETISLQFISGYLSIGSIFAFIIGGLIYEILKEKKFHFIVGIFTFLSICLILIFKYFFILNNYVVGGITLIIGFFYGLWGILKNIVISYEIEKNYSTDTKINGLANIFFITSIVIGSILGGILVEKLNIYGIYVILFLIILGIIFGLFIENSKNKNDELSFKEKSNYYKNNYIKDFVFILKKYFLTMCFIGFLLVIATILSQKAIEYSVEVLKIKQSIASSLLLFSAIGSIIGNVLSMKISKNKWLYFMIFCFLFAIFTILLPIFIKSFNITKIIAFIAGIFFGITFNLLESNFFKNIGIDNKKSYGGASLGIIIAFVISIMMFLIDHIDNKFGFTGSYIFLAGIIIIIGITIFVKEKK